MQGQKEIGATLCSALAATACASEYNTCADALVRIYHLSVQVGGRLPHRSHELFSRRKLFVK
jgi:hypothetical protein